MAIWYLTYKENDWLKDDLNSGSSKETGTNLTFRAGKIQANAIETSLPWWYASEGEARVRSPQIHFQSSAGLFHEMSKPWNSLTDTEDPVKLTLH